MFKREKDGGRLPNFFIIGAAKSGTSSLYKYLDRHPEIFIPEIKETEYFSKASVYIKGEEWYKGLFEGAKKNQICGDASTTYSRWPHTLDAPKLIAKSVPDAKFIYIMRHPVERSYSHYAHHMRLGVTMTFEESIEKDDIYVDCSTYMRQIERYLRFFPRERFLFIFQTQMKDQPKKLLDSIIAFLGAKNIDIVSEGTIRHNVGGSDHYIRSKTTQKLRKISHIGYIANFIPKRVKESMYTILKQSFLGRRLDSQYQLQPMKPETRKALLELFEKPNRDLEEFLDVQIDSWYI